MSSVTLLQRYDVHFCGRVLLLAHKPRFPLTPQEPLRIPVSPCALVHGIYWRLAARDSVNTGGAYFQMRMKGIVSLLHKPMAGPAAVQCSYFHTRFSIGLEMVTGERETPQRTRRSFRVFARHVHHEALLPSHWISFFDSEECPGLSLILPHRFLAARLPMVPVSHRRWLGHHPVVRTDNEDV